MRFLAKPLWQILTFCVVVGLAFILTGTRAGAFADTYIGSYGWNDNYGPYRGYVYGTNIVSSSPEILQAEQWGMRWSSAQLAGLRPYYYGSEAVFHVFKRSTSNCALPFDYTGFYETNGPIYQVVGKEAICVFDGYSGHKNEVRIVWNTSQLLADTSYYGGAEFRLNSGGTQTPYDGKVSNDVYYETGPVRKPTNVTWCFSGSLAATGC